MKTYVALVVGRVKVLSIPAGGEEGLSTDTSARETGKLRSLTLINTAEAYDGDGSILNVGSVEGSASWVSNHHTKSSRRGDGVRSAVAVGAARSIVASTGKVVSSLSMLVPQLHITKYQ